MSVHQKKDGRWFVKYYEDGKEKRRFFGRGDLARLQAENRDLQIKSAKTLHKAADYLTVSELLSAYHTTHPVRHSTGFNNAYKIKILASELGHIPAEVLSHADLHAYVKKRQQTVKDSTISREIRLLKAAFSWAESSEPPLIVRNPIAKFKPPPEDRDVPLPLSQTEIQKLLAAASPHLFRALLICWHTGIRPGGELLRLTWEDCDFNNALLRIQSARKGNRHATRHVPVDSIAQDLSSWFSTDREKLKMRDPGADPLKLTIVHYEFRPVVSLKGTWEKTKRRAGISRRLRLYDCRHAFANLLIDAAVDIRTVSELMGHSRPDTTLKEYVHPSTRRHREAAATIPALIHEIKKE